MLDSASLPLENSDRTNHHIENRSRVYLSHLFDRGCSFVELFAIIITMRADLEMELEIFRCVS